SWPKKRYGRIPGSLGETWLRVNAALARGYRGLPGGSSIARLLAEERGVRNRSRPPHLAIRHILAWADSYYKLNGRWPTSLSGPIPEAPGETWRAVDKALSDGWRGLPGGSSLAVLLAAQRGRRHHMRLPKLTEK